MSSSINRKNMNIYSILSKNTPTIVAPPTIVPPTIVSSHIRSNAPVFRPSQQRMPESFEHKNVFVKTRPCNEMSTKGHCYRGNECHFANYIEELVDPSCGFANCNRRNHKTLRPGQTVCTLKHLDETSDTYRKRVHPNLRLPSNGSRVVEDIPREERRPVRVVENTLREERSPVSRIIQDTSIEEKRPVEERPFIIRTKKEDVSSCVIEALLRGIVNFDIEIIV